MDAMNLDTTIFRIDMPKKDEMSFAFGETQFTLPLEAAYELQFQLASALAQLELLEYPEATQEEVETCSVCSEPTGSVEASRSAWESLVALPMRSGRARRLDS
jgi:hypothetical protein